MTTLKCKLVEYDVWGNDVDGYDVNDIYTVIDDLCIVDDNDDMTCKQIAKCFHGQYIEGNWLNPVSDSIKIDFRSLEVIDSWPYIEFETKSGKPVGRIEIAE